MIYKVRKRKLKVSLFGPSAFSNTNAIKFNNLNQQEKRKEKYNSINKYNLFLSKPFDPI